jgi:hypothetical protein
MIIDCRSSDFIPHRDCRRVFVGDREVHQVFYVDTDLGIAKTYDVADGNLGLFTAHDDLPIALLQRGLEEEWNMPEDGIFSKTVRGIITFAPCERPGISRKA